MLGLGASNAASCRIGEQLPARAAPQCDLWQCMSDDRRVLASEVRHRLSWPVLGWQPRIQPQTVEDHLDDRPLQDSDEDHETSAASLGHGRREQRQPHQGDTGVLRDRVGHLQAQRNGLPPDTRDGVGRVDALGVGARRQAADTGDRIGRRAAVVDSDTEQTRIELFEQVGIDVEVGGAVTPRTAGAG